MNKQEEALKRVEAAQAELALAKEALVEETTYSVGDRFMCPSGKGMLSRAGNDIVVMSSLRSGHLHFLPVQVKEPHKITPAELAQICTCDSVRYWDSQRKIYTGKKKDKCLGCKYMPAAKGQKK